MKTSNSFDTKYDDNFFIDLIRRMNAASGRSRISPFSFPKEIISSAFYIAKSEADRSAAILLFSLAEDIMAKCFLDHLEHNVPGGIASAFSHNGVLATANDRISMLELLRWINPSTACDLKLMKSIRNTFAHHSNVHNFSDSKIQGWTSSMSPIEKSAFKEYENIKHLLDIRKIYLIRSISTICKLAIDTAINPIAFQEKSPPADILGQGFEGLPDNIKEFIIFQGSLMNSVLYNE